MDEFRNCNLPSKEIGKSNRRIYLTRSKNRLRFIENGKQVIEVLKKYNFEIIDTDNIPITKQIEIFGSARYLIAIHGAGLVNILLKFWVWKN